MFAMSAHKINPDDEATIEHFLKLLKSLFSIYGVVSSQEIVKRQVHCVERVAIVDQQYGICHVELITKTASCKATVRSEYFHPHGPTKKLLKSQHFNLEVK